MDRYGNEPTVTAAADGLATRMLQRYGAALYTTGWLWQGDDGCWAVDSAALRLVFSHGEKG